MPRGLLVILFLALVCAVVVRGGGTTTIGKKHAFFSFRALRPAAVAAALLLGGQSSLAAPDCQQDCYKNCLIAAPGSKDYCQSTCVEYCDDPEREDGLSGSKGSSKGETGIFGGSVDSILGTTTIDLPPKSINFIDPVLSTKYGASSSRIDSSMRHK